jgi:hypothetical protein
MPRRYSSRGTGLRHGIRRPQLRPLQALSHNRAACVRRSGRRLLPAGSGSVKRRRRPPRGCRYFVIGKVFGADPGSVGDRSWVNPIARHALSDPAIPIAPAAAKPAFAFVAERVSGAGAAGADFRRRCGRVQCAAAGGLGDCRQSRRASAALSFRLDGCGGRPVGLYYAVSPSCRRHSMAAIRAFPLTSSFRFGLTGP